MADRDLRQETASEPALVQVQRSTAAKLANCSVATLATPWKSNAAYRAYVERQITKTQKYQRLVSGNRVATLIGLWVRAMVPDRPFDRSVLAVGCRNTWELDVLHAAGFGPVVGIDLSSQDLRIRAMDMHQLQFPDASFDSVFASHSLEHSYDPDVVLAEWARVTKPEGYWVIEVPINFEATPVDRQNFGSVVSLLHRCRAVVDCTPVVTEELMDRIVARLVLKRR